jgi:hypothetical protein
MIVIAQSALRILIPRRNCPGHLRYATRQLIRQTIAQIHAESRAGSNAGLR